MQKYSISQVSEMLDLSRDTLRYYERLGLVSPFRGDNRYRYYSDEEINQLKYILVMKYGGFSLEEIKNVFNNMKIAQTDCQNDTACINTTLLLESKKVQTRRKIQQLSKIIKLLSLSVERLQKKKSQQDITELVAAIWSQIECEKEDEKEMTK